MAQDNTTPVRAGVCITNLGPKAKGLAFSAQAANILQTASNPAQSRLLAPPSRK